MSVEEPSRQCQRTLNWVGRKASSVKQLLAHASRRARRVLWTRSPSAPPPPAPAADPKQRPAEPRLQNFVQEAPLDGPSSRTPGGPSPPLPEAATRCTESDSEAHRAVEGMEVPAEEQRREDEGQRRAAQEETRRREEEERRVGPAVDLAAAARRAADVVRAAKAAAAAAAAAEEQRREEEEQRRAAQEEARRREEEERRAAEEEEQRREEQEERRRAAEAAIERVLACGASDHCAVLAVSREADVGALKEAYRQLSLLSHPDKCSHPRAKEAFIRIKASFEALCADIEGKHNAAAERAAAERAAAERAAKKAAAEKAAAEKAAAERAFNRRIMRDEMFAERFIEQAFAAHIDNIFESAFSRFEDRLDRLGDDLFDF